MNKGLRSVEGVRFTRSRRNRRSAFGPRWTLQKYTPLRRRVGELLDLGSMSSSWCRRIFAGGYFEWTDDGEELEDETFLPAAVKRLTATAGDGSLPRSKMGGEPDLLPGTTWPMRPSADRDTCFSAGPPVVTTYRLPLDGAVAFLCAFNPRLGEGCAARIVTRLRRSPGSVAPGSPGELVKLMFKACDETVTSFPLAFMLQINLAHVDAPSSRPRCHRAASSRSSMT